MRSPSARRSNRRRAARCRRARACCGRSALNSNGSTTISTTSAISPSTTTLKVGEAEGKLLEERAKQINGRLTGSRFLRSLLIPGGLRRDLDPTPWLGDELERLREEIAGYMEMLESTNSHLDRLITTGILPHEVAFDQGATGPIQRASGFDRDLRRDHPYAGLRAICR